MTNITFAGSRMTNVTLKGDKNQCPDVWIEFQGDQAVTGLTAYRMAGVKKIKEIEFFRIYIAKKKGEPLATIKFDHTCFKVYMLFDGRVVAINDVSTLTDIALMPQMSETHFWLARIEIPSYCYNERLLTGQEYNSIFLPPRK